MRIPITHIHCDKCGKFIGSEEYNNDCLDQHDLCPDCEEDVMYWDRVKELKIRFLKISIEEKRTAQENWFHQK
jgi:Zn finger protein HypA/HybF involved in hydrogenase expression